MNRRKLSIKFFVTPTIPGTVLLVLFCVGWWYFPYLMGRQPFMFRKDFPIVLSVFSFNPGINNFASLLFTLLNAMLIQNLNLRFNILRKRSFLPFLIFLFLIAGWYPLHFIWELHFALSIFILSFYYFFDMYRQPTAVEQAFMGSFLIAVASLILPPLLWIMPVVWLNFLQMRAFTLRTFLASILGIVAPWLLFAGGYFVLQENPDFNKLIFSRFFVENKFDFSSFQSIDLIYFLSLAAILLISVVYIYMNFQRDNISTRSKLNILIIQLLILLGISIFHASLFYCFLPFTVFFFALLLSHPFSTSENNFFSILFIVFCLLNVAFVLFKIIA
ncbi:hypothetical protein RDV77_02020 [Porphyromonadaceae sp. NP-X]|nr:hypothetical protein [Porphyromonadaceae sp. NP-X]